jgi:hypothetical protein
VVVTRVVVAAIAGCALAIVAAGCGAGEESARPGDEPVRAMRLKQACPAVHVLYDGLVASDPASARDFRESLRRLSRVGIDETRDAMAPLVTAAGDLAQADRTDFPAARDAVYSAIVTLSATCATVGSPILHAGH